MKYLDREFNKLSIQNRSNVIYVSVHIYIIQCLERNHTYIYIVYIAHFELVVFFWGEKRSSSYPGIFVKVFKIFSPI